MKQWKVKVCGMTRIGQIQELAEMGVAYAGLIFYEKSPRYVEGKLDPLALKQVNGLQKVGVFVNESVENILEQAKRYGLDAVQLHGDETPELCYALKDKLDVIKAFRISGEEAISPLIEPYKTAADYFLFDTKATEYGGTGKKFNWSVLERERIEKPYFLSGGIGLSDVEAIKLFTARNNVFSLDLNSRFETAPGVKDMDALKAFYRQMENPDNA